MERLTKTYSDGTHGANDNLPCGENSYTYKGLLLEALGKYEDADEQGLLLRLPVKVGDTVYTIRYGKENDFVVVETKIIEIRQNVNGIFFEPLISRKAYKINDFGKEVFFEPLISRKAYKIDDFGKEVFLTRAEAEQKLKEMEDD